MEQPSLFRSPTSGSIKAVLKRLHRPAVTPGAMGVFSAFPAPLFFRWSSAALSSSLLRAAMELRPPFITILTICRILMPWSSIHSHSQSRQSGGSLQRSPASLFPCPARPRRPVFFRVIMIHSSPCGSRDICTHHRHIASSTLHGARILLPSPGQPSPAVPEGKQNLRGCPSSR